MIRVFRTNSANIRTVRVYRKNAAVFREEDHPRDKSGRFGKGDGGAKKSEEKAPAGAGKEPAAKPIRVASLPEKPNTDMRQKSNNRDEIINLTKDAGPAFENYVNAYAKKFGLGVKSRSELKSLSRIEEKAQEDPGKGYAGIVDIDAKTLVVDEVDKLYDVYNALLKDPAVVRAKNRFATPTQAGYRDLLTNVQMPNGAIVELQVSTPQMIGAKDLVHALYEVERVMEFKIKAGTASDVERDVHSNLQKIQEKVYGAAWEASLRSDASFKASSLVKTDAKYLKSVEDILGSGFSDLSEKTRKHWSEFLSTAYGNPSESKKSRPGESTVNADMVSTSDKSVAQKENINKFRIFRASR